MINPPAISANLQKASTSSRAADHSKASLSPKYTVCVAPTPSGKPTTTTTTTNAQINPNADFGASQGPVQAFTFGKHCGVFASVPVYAFDDTCYLKSSRRVKTILGKRDNYNLRRTLSMYSIDHQDRGEILIQVGDELYVYLPIATAMALSNLPKHASVDELLPSCQCFIDIFLSTWSGDGDGRGDAPLLFGQIPIVDNGLDFGEYSRLFGFKSKPPLINAHYTTLASRGYSSESLKWLQSGKSVPLHAAVIHLLSSIRHGSRSLTSRGASVVNRLLSGFSSPQWIQARGTLTSHVRIPRTASIVHPVVDPHLSSVSLDTLDVSNARDSANRKTFLKPSVDVTASIILCSPPCEKTPPDTDSAQSHQLLPVKAFIFQKHCGVFASLSVYAIDNRSFLKLSPILLKIFGKRDAFNMAKSLEVNYSIDADREVVIATHEERYISLSVAILLAVQNLPKYADVAQISQQSCQCFINILLSTWPPPGGDNPPLFGGHIPVDVNNEIDFNEYAKLFKPGQSQLVKALYSALSSRGYSVESLVWLQSRSRVPFHASVIGLLAMRPSGLSALGASVLKWLIGGVPSTRSLQVKLA